MYVFWYDPSGLANFDFYRSGDKYSWVIMIFSGAFDNSDYSNKKIHQQQYLLPNIQLSVMSWTYLLISSSHGTKIIYSPFLVVSSHCHCLYFPVQFPSSWYQWSWWFVSFGVLQNVSSNSHLPFAVFVYFIFSVGVLTLPILMVLPNDFKNQHVAVYFIPFHCPRTTAKHHGFNCW